MIKNIIPLLIGLIIIQSCDTQKKNFPAEDNLSVDQINQAELSANKWVKSSLDSSEVNDMISTPDGRIIAATTSGLYLSEDNGATWNVIDVPLTENTNYKSLAINEEGILFCALQKKGLIRSSDHGKSWERLEAPEGVSVVQEVYTLNGKVFAGSFKKGAFRSDDNGETWVRISKGLPNVRSFNKERMATVKAFANSGDYLYALTEGGVTCSRNYGDDWTKCEHENLYDLGLITAVTAKESMLFAGKYLNDGIYMSADSGRTWARSGLQGKNLRSLYVSLGGNIYAGTEGYGAFRSLDNGERWVNISRGLPNGSTVVSFISTPSGVILAGTKNKGIYRLGGSLVSSK